MLKKIVHKKKNSKKRKNDSKKNLLKKKINSNDGTRRDASKSTKTKITFFPDVRMIDDNN